MNNQTNKLIPELRFPEFYNEAGWENKKFGNTISIIIDNRGKTPPIENKGIPLLEVNSIGEKEIKYDLVTKFVSEFTFDDWFRKHLSTGDVLFSTVGRTALCSYYDGKIKAAIAQNIVGFRFKEENGLFMYYLLSEESNFIKMKAIEMGAVQPSIKVTQLTELYFIYPKPTEQKKIADCLSTLDDVITAYNDKLETLKVYKKGLMQNLFPQEVERVPKIRFKEFDKDGDWIFEPLNKVYLFLVTNSFSRENLNYKNGTVKNIHYGDIHTKFSTLFDITKEKVPFINSEVSIDRIRQECYCKEGDIIFADASEDLNDVGKSIEIINLNNEKLLSGLHTLLARQIEPKLVVGFSGYLFQSNKIRNQIKKEAQGAKVLGVSGTRLSNIEIYYPKNNKEQQKISKTLSSVDDLIKEQLDKIEQLKLHKKGLMQGLFPKAKN